MYSITTREILNLKMDQILSFVRLAFQYHYNILSLSDEYEELLKFFIIKIYHYVINFKKSNIFLTRHEDLSPSLLIDDKWHKIILSPTEYYKFCDDIMPKNLLINGCRIIPHFPDGVNDKDQNNRYEKTIELYQKLFCFDINFKIWNLLCNVCYEYKMISQCSLCKYNICNECLKKYNKNICPQCQRQSFIELNSFVIFVKKGDANGRTFILNVQKNNTINDIKKLIIKHEKLDIGIDVGIRIIYAGVQLQDNLTIADYDIQKESTIYYVLRLRGC